MIGGNLGGDALDGYWIADIEFDRDHAGICIAYGLKSRCTSTRDDHLVAANVKRLGKTAADSGTSAGDEYCITVHFHEALLESVLKDSYLTSAYAQARPKRRSAVHRGSEIGGYARWHPPRRR